MGSDFLGTAHNWLEHTAPWESSSYRIFWFAEGNGEMTAPNPEQATGFIVPSSWTGSQLPSLRLRSALTCLSLCYLTLSLSKPEAAKQGRAVK